MLSILNQIPDGFLESSPEELHTILSGPTLIHLDGLIKEPLFVSVLLHGNEPTGLIAIQAVLKKIENQTFPRALSIFIGNVSAAQKNNRHTKQQPDYNRIWPYVGHTGDSPEHKMMETIVDTMRDKKVFASIDVHNNTGLNPHYGCINELDHRFFHLAKLFSRKVVYFIRPKGVQSMAFAELCPSVTVECGKPDQPYGASHAADFIHTCLQLSDLPDQPIAEHDIDLYHTVATVTVPDSITYRFSDEESCDPKSADICFPTTLDHFNFTELAVGATLGFVNPDNKEIPLIVTNELGKNATDQYLHIECDELRTSKEVMPSMLTLDREVIRQDCLGYLMERMELNMEI